MFVWYCSLIRTNILYQSVLGVDFSDFFANRQFQAGVNCGQVLILLILSNFSANCKTLVDFLLEYGTISVSFLIRITASMFLFLSALITYVSSFWSFWHSFFWTLLLSVTDSSINNLILFLEWTWSPRLSVPSVGTSGNFLAKVVAHGLRHFFCNPIIQYFVIIITAANISIDEFSSHQNLIIENMITRQAIVVDICKIVKWWCWRIH